jgi:tetratricopeptide (TPR) repeat protein/TolB-like protein
MIVLVLLQRRTTLPLDEQRIRISVIPFQDMTGSADWKDWPMVIQSLIVGELTGIEQFGIVDPFSLNNLMSASFGTAVAERSVNVYDILKSLDADYMVGGNITQTGSQLRIVCTLTDISTREVRFSTEAVATGEADLESTVKVLVEKLLDFFQVKVFQSNLIQDLRPWLPQRTRNISALRAFMEAAELIYRNERGVESLLQQAVALDSMFISARVWLISVLVGRGKHEEARTHHQFLTRIERQASPFDRAMIRWAGGYMSGNVHTQEIALREALQYSSGNFILQMNLGIVYYNQKRFRASLEVLSDAVRLGWSYPQLYYLYAVNLKQLGQWTKAKQFLEDNLTMASPYRLTYSLLAALHLQAGDTARYRFYEDQLIQLSLHRGDSLHRTYGSQARYLASEGFYHEAARLYRQALQLEPRREEYKLGYGEVLLLLGELHEAERQFRDLLGSNPEFKSAYFFLGELYTRQGDSIRAAQYFRQFLSLDSTSIMGQKARRRLQHSVE